MRKASYHEALHYLKKRAERNMCMDSNSISSIRPQIKMFAERRKSRFEAALLSLKRLFGYMA